MSALPTLDTIIFDIDDTLYDSTRQAAYARRNAIEAMIDAGLDVEADIALDQLRQVIRQYGSNYQFHYDELLRRLGRRPTPRLVAAGIVAYHNVKLTYLHPFEETIPTLLRLRDLGYKLGIITNGLAVKQWEKLIRLGLQHFFHGVIVSTEVGVEKPAVEIFQTACEQLETTPVHSAFVGNHLETDIAGANRAGMFTVRLLKGKYAAAKPTSAEQRADREIRSLHEVLALFEGR